MFEKNKYSSESHQDYVFLFLIIYLNIIITNMFVICEGGSFYDRLCFNKGKYIWLNSERYSLTLNVYTMFTMCSTLRQPIQTDLLDLIITLKNQWNWYAYTTKNAFFSKP